jgi:hypothetical protein
LLKLCCAVQLGVDGMPEPVFEARKTLTIPESPFSSGVTTTRSLKPSPLMSPAVLAIAPAGATLFGARGRSGIVVFGVVEIAPAAAMDNARHRPSVSEISAR